MTQAQLAERAGCHSMTLAKLEQGLHEPAWPLVLALAQALGVDCRAFQSEEPGEVTPAEPRPRGRPARVVDATLAEPEASTPTPEPAPQPKRKGRKKDQGEKPAKGKRKGKGQD